MYRRSMMPSWLVVAAFGIGAGLVGSVWAENCEQDHWICGAFEFCDLHIPACKPCEDICDEPRSYDCREKCKDYLVANELKAALRNQKITIWILSAIIAAFIIVLVGMIWWVLKIKKVSLQCPLLPWQKKNNVTPAVAMTHENPNTRSPPRTPKNPANLTRQDTQPTTVSTDQDVETQTTDTKISNRYPAEDSTEGVAYDNFAYSTPPSSGSKPRY